MSAWRWLERRFMRRLLARPTLRAVDWTEAERNAYNTFCSSGTGAKLLEFLRQSVATSTFNAVCRDSASANARARGQQEMLAILHRLRVFPVTEESADWAEVEGVEPAPKKAKDDSGDWHRYGGRGAISSPR